MDRSARIYFILLAGTLLWCALIVLAPICRASGSPALKSVGDLLYALFGPICHQIDARSFHVLGAPLAVCSRCSSVYFGFLFGVLLYPLVFGPGRYVQRGRWVLALALAPMLVDVFVDVLGVHESTMFTRAITGGWFGLLAPLSIVPAAVRGLEEIFARPSPFIQPEKGQQDA
jgi:uncharacterized membrane protein